MRDSRRIPRIRIIMAVIVAAAIAVTVASAAQPKPGATYAGNPPQYDVFNGQQQRAGNGHIRFTVSSSGNRLGGRWTYTINCGTVPVTSMYHGPIANDGTFLIKFTGTDSNGGQHHERLAGEFIRHGKAAKVKFRDFVSNVTGCAPAIVRGKVHKQ